MRDSMSEGYDGDPLTDSAYELVSAGLASATYDVQVFPPSAVTDEFGAVRVVRLTVR